MNSWISRLRHHFQVQKKNVHKVILRKKIRIFTSMKKKQKKPKVLKHLEIQCCSNCICVNEDTSLKKKSLLYIMNSILKPNEAKRIFNCCSQMSLRQQSRAGIYLWWRFLHFSVVLCSPHYFRSIHWCLRHWNRYSSDTLSEGKRAS